MENKKTVRRLTALIAATLLLVWVFGGAVSAADEASEEAAVSFLYFNDGHEISPVADKLGNRGGVARIKTLVDSVKGDKIVAFGGDLGGGTLFGGVFKGFPMVEAFNRIPIDTANFGQHDFDAGAANTLELIRASTFGWISSNLVGPDGKPFGNVAPYRLFEKQGIRIGVIGLTSAMNSTTQDASVKQLDVIESAKKAVEELKRDQRPDVIIALTQETVQEDKALLQAIPDIRVVLTEEEAEETSFTYDFDGMGSRYIFSPQGNMGSVIRLEFRKGGDGQVALTHEIMKADQSVQEDPQLGELAKQYQNKLDEELGKQIAKADTDFLYGDNHESRFKETEIGNLIADAYRDIYKTDVAFANGGGIRASAKRGDFTLKDAKSILPFGNKIVVAEVSGDMLLAALENGVSGVDRLAGGFLQVSGASYVYNPAKPAGARIEQAQVNGKPLDKAKTYTIALSNFMYTGGDKYSMFANAKTVIGANEALTDVELLVSYAKKAGVLTGKSEGRITVNGYADVTNGHWAQEEVYGLKAKSVMAGMSDARFAPQQAVTYGEWMELLRKVPGLEKGEAPAFTGQGMPSHDTKAPLTREELAVYVKWAFETKTGKRLEAGDKLPFADGEQISDWAKQAVTDLARIGVLTGRAQDVFAPKEPATRAEAALLLWKLMKN